MPNSKDLERARRKHRALMRARMSLRQMYERIDYDLDVVQPALKEVAAGASRGELPEFTDPTEESS